MSVTSGVRTDLASEPRQSSRQKPLSGGSAWIRLVSFVAVVALLSVAAWVVPLAQTEFQSDYSASPARFLLQRWTEGKARPNGRSQWETALGQLRQASDMQPSDPELHQSIGKAWMVGASQPWASPVERVLWLEQARFHLRQATSLQPRAAWNWALTASALEAAGLIGPELEHAAHNALKFGPNEGYVHDILLHVVLKHWDKLSAGLQGWVRGVYGRGNTSQRAAIEGLATRYGRQFQGSP